ncbi:MAG: stage II sporulation protein P [Clostridia bacterium]|nr:stage II sporulation protein P [Clostridia bacterium]MDD4047938.1 stage II sporulation protein P [Clostridia bacterium]
MLLKYRIQMGKSYYIIKCLFLFAVALILVTIITFISNKCDNLQLIPNLIGQYKNNSVMILNEGFPSVFYQVNDDISGKRFNDIIYQASRILTGVDTRNPSSVLCNGLNVLPVNTVMGNVSFAAASIEEDGGEEDFYLPGNNEELEEWIIIQEDEYPFVQLNGEPMIFIYNTHNAESYKPTQGTSKLDGRNGGIANVSETFKKAIEGKHSIKTIYSDVIHDYPVFTKSYINSRQTAKKFIKEYPKLQAVIDIHRDAGMNTRKDTLVRINGKDCAKVMIVIGTEHSKWKQNLAFAQKIEKKANELYPGLLKCVRSRENRCYNQDLHTHAVLFEVGSDLNKEEDAINSAKLMADVIAEVLKKK